MRLLAMCLTSLLLASETVAFELGADAGGQAIVVESLRRDEGFGDAVVEVTMILRNAQGRERRRRLTWSTLEAKDKAQGDRSLVVFHEPKDIAGTGFLSHTYVAESDEQWLYLPSLKRVKRIASANKSSPFVGSEFAYEDLLSIEEEKFDHDRLEDESCGERECFVLERQPLDPNSGYARQTVWLDKAELRMVKVEFHDRKGRQVKTLVLEDYRQYLGRHWRAHRLTMENHQSRKITVLEFQDYRFRTGLDENDFEPWALRRLR